MKKLIIIVSVSLLSFKTFSQCNITVSNHITSDPDVTYYMAQPEVIYSNQSVDGIIQVNAYIFKLYSANGVKTILNIQVYKKGSREMISPKTLSFSYGGLNKLHTLKPFNVEDIETTSDGFLSQTEEKKTPVRTILFKVFMKPTVSISIRLFLIYLLNW